MEGADRQPPLRGICRPSASRVLAEGYETRGEAHKQTNYRRQQAEGTESGGGGADGRRNMRALSFSDPR